MRKPKTTEAGERILLLESALVWAMNDVDFCRYKLDALTIECPWCLAEGKRLYLTAEHKPQCPYRRARELLKGLRPREWEGGRPQ